MVSALFVDEYLKKFTLSCLELIGESYSDGVRAGADTVICDSGGYAMLSETSARENGVKIILLLRREEKERCTPHEGTEILEFPTELSAFSRVLGHGKSASLPGVGFDGRRVSMGAVTVELTEKEARLFGYLWENEGRYVSREELSREVWGKDGGTNIADVYVSYLRKKLGTTLGEGAISSKRGAGYKLNLGIK